MNHFTYFQLKYTFLPRFADIIVCILGTTMYQNFFLKGNRVNMARALAFVRQFSLALIIIRSLSLVFLLIETDKKTDANQNILTIMLSVLTVYTVIFSPMPGTFCLITTFVLITLISAYCYKITKLP